MKAFSLRTIIDDILLIVRNNNISESEDFSRAQIAAWVLQYKAYLLKEKLNQNNKDDVDDNDELDSLCKVVGPLKLRKVQSLDDTHLFKKETVDKLDDVFDDNPNNIIAVFDQEHCPIQRMHGQRRHFHFFRKYTAGELTYEYENDRIVVCGINECCFKYIWVKYIASDSEEADEDDVEIPGWMVPTIKELIFKNELSFMIKMPSDDDNNSTLDGIKPHGPQDQEK